VDGQPAFVVRMKRLAIGKAEQSGAVVDLDWYFGLIRLGLGDGGKPGAEGLSILGGVETEKVGVPSP
jgi:hypothetical protein